MRDFCLKREFLWKPCKRRYFEPEGDHLCHDELVFIARIPLAPITTRFTLWASTTTDSTTPIFVVFFQKRQNGLDNLENPIDGKVFTSFNGDMHFNVKTEFEACFLYAVPGDATQ